MSDNQLSASDIERMRAILAQHDAQNRTGIKEFDLNNPPKEPYAHQAFPTVVYHHGKRQMRKAHTEDDLAIALEAGWSKTPFPAESEEPELDDQTAEEVAALEAKARRAAKRK